VLIQKSLLDTREKGECEFELEFVHELHERWSAADNFGDVPFAFLPSFSVYAFVQEQEFVSCSRSVPHLSVSDFYLPCLFFFLFSFSSSSRCVLDSDVLLLRLLALERKCFFLLSSSFFPLTPVFHSHLIFAILVFFAPFMPVPLNPSCFLFYVEFPSLRLRFTAPLIIVLSSLIASSLPSNFPFILLNYYVIF